MTLRTAVLALSALILSGTAGAMSGSGSGTVVGVRGEILTAAHVVHGCGAIQIVFPDGRRAAARLEAFDPVGDLALLRASVAGGTPPRLREGIAKGETVHVNSFPASAEGKPVFSSSRVSRLAGPKGERDAMSFDGRMTVGESGSGVFDGYGNLVGVAYAAAEQRWHAVGIARVSEFLLSNRVPIASGAPVGTVSLSQISSYLRLIAVQIHCWSDEPQAVAAPQPPPRR